MAVTFQFSVKVIAAFVSLGEYLFIELHDSNLFDLRSRVIKLGSVLSSARSSAVAEICDSVVGEGLETILNTQIGTTEEKMEKDIETLSKLKVCIGR